MSIKVDVRTNITDYELTLEKCSQIIILLQDTYRNIRNDMYAQLLGKKILFKTSFLAMIFICLYLFTKSVFFLYSTPVFVGMALVIAIISAEYLTTQTRKQIKIQLLHYKRAQRQLQNQKIRQ